MAQSGYTPILIYASSTPGALPSAANLTSSASGAELAINYADGKLYFKNSSGVVTLLAGSSSGPAGGSNTQVQYNSSGVLAGSSNMTFNGTKLTVAGFLDSALTSGRVPYATTSGELTDSANLLYSGTDLTVYGITVGRGAGAVSTNTAVGASALGGGSQTGQRNTAMGVSALAANTSGNDNSAFGRLALLVNTTGNGNNAFGSASLYSNTTGSTNNAFGDGALFNNTTGGNNTAVGGSALFSNTTASNNTAVGYQAGYSNTTGGITALGAQAGYSNTTGTGNTAVGDGAMRSNTTGLVNSSFGASSLYSNTTGNYNNAFGASDLAVAAGALNANTTGAANNAFGNGALGSNSTGGDNSAFGHRALNRNTTSNNNSAFGSGALLLNTTGASNTALGTQSLLSNTTASNNTAVGYRAGYAATTSANNVYVGSQAGLNATGDTNTFVGAFAGQNITTGIRNTYIGNSVAFNTTTGSNNTFIGVSAVGAAGSEVTTGSKNTILGGYNGNQGGLDIRTASNHIVLSDGDGNPRMSCTNSGDWQISVGAAGASTGVYPGIYASYGAGLSGMAGEAAVVNNLYYGSGAYRFLATNGGGGGSLSISYQGNITARAVGGTGATAGAVASLVDIFTVAPSQTFGLQGAGSFSGTGITFPATQNASSNANTLDDYEEGTYVVTLTPDTSGSITLNGSINELSYIKVGSQVTIFGRILINSVSSPVGAIRVNMPFTPETGLADQSDFYAMPMFTHDVDLSAGALSVFGESSGSNYWVIYQTLDNAAWTALPAANLKGNNNEFFYITGSYRAA